MSTRISREAREIVLGFASNPFALSLSKRRTSAATEKRTALRQAQGERWWWLLPLSLAACGEPPSSNVTAPVAESSNQSAAPGVPEVPKIPCAAAGEAALALACTVDRAETADGVILTLRHPDGAFHRLQITRDGRGVIAADGAEPATVTPLRPDRIEVAIGGARYRLPAIVRGQPR